MASANRSSAPQTRDDSVMFALGELARLEADRVAGERERERRRVEEEHIARERELEARAAEARLAEEREHKARVVAEAEARLRVEAELAQDARMTTLRAELARVQSEREAMHRTVLEVARPAPGPTPARGWPLAFGLSSVVAAALAGLLVLQAQSAPRVIEVERRVIVEAPPAASSVEAPAPAVPVEVAVPVVTAPTPEPRPARHRPVAARPPVTRPVVDRDDGLDFEGDGEDVIGGIDHDASDMFGGRRRGR